MDVQVPRVVQMAEAIRSSTVLEYAKTSCAQGVEERLEKGVSCASSSSLSCSSWANEVVQQGWPWVPFPENELPTLAVEVETVESDWATFYSSTHSGLDWRG